jgi:hypothetical protein
MGASEDIDNAMLAALERIRATIAANITEKGLKASGRTAASMRIERETYGMRLVGRPYFQSLELGRPSGRVPRNFAAIIRQWIIDKGLSVRMIPYKREPSERWQPKYTVEERSLRMAAGAIAHKIATSGTMLYRQGGRSDIYTPIIREEVDRLQKTYTDIVAKSIAGALSGKRNVGQ